MVYNGKESVSKGSVSKSVSVVIQSLDEQK